MPAVLTVLAAHDALAGYLATHDAPPVLAAVPNPAPLAPPGMTRRVTLIIAWGKWGVLILGVFGLLVCAGKMAIGHRSRATLAADGATGIPWVLGGLSLAAISAAIVTVFLG